MRRKALAKVRVVIFGSVIGVLVSSLVPHTAQAGSALWTPTPSNQSAITQAYTQAGGKGGLGVASGSPEVWGGGCAQDYTGGRAKSAAIIVSSCADISKEPEAEAPTEPKKNTPAPRVVRGEFWEYTKDHGASLLGSPLSDDQLLEDGRWQTFAGGTWGATELYQSNRSQDVYAVRDHIRTWYAYNGGPSSQLGWPVSEQYDWSGEVRQDFEFGSLVWRTEVGARPLVSWSNGQVLASPTADPTRYVMRELRSYAITSDTQLNRCYGGKSAVRIVSPDQLDLTKKKYKPSGTASDCVTPAEQSAIDWATSQLRKSWSPQLQAAWSGRCETFVEMAFGTRARALSASEHYNWRSARGQIHTDASAPAGTLVFYGGSDDGHVGLSIGNGMAISTQGYLGDQLPVWQHRVAGLSNQYLGWAYMDGGWPR